MLTSQGFTDQHVVSEKDHREGEVVSSSPVAPYPCPLIHAQLLWSYFLSTASCSACLSIFERPLMPLRRASS